MAKFIIRDIDQLNLLLDKVKSNSPGSYELINSYFQAFLDNDNFLMKQIKTEIRQVIDKLESGEIFIPQAETGPGALGVPTFLGDTEPEIDKSIDYIWFKPIRKTQVVDPDEYPLLFVLDAKESEDGWHLNVEDILYTIMNTADSVEEAEDGEIVISPLEDGELVLVPVDDEEEE